MKVELGVPFTVDAPTEVRSSTPVVVVTGYSQGKATLLALDVGRIDAALFTTDGSTITLGSLEVAEPASLKTSPELMDLKPLLAAAINPLWLVLLAAAAALAWKLWRRGPAAAPALPAQPELSPHEEAERALAALAAVRGRELYIGITAVLRRYIERRYLEPATKLNTSELARLLRRLEVPPALYRELFQRADLVKFAKVQAEESWAAEDLAAALRFVRETSPSLVEEKT
jgi:hypothetical protein